MEELRKSLGLYGIPFDQMSKDVLQCIFVGPCNNRYSRGNSTLGKALVKLLITESLVFQGGTINRVDDRNLADRRNKLLEAFGSSVLLGGQRLGEMQLSEVFYELVGALYHYLDSHGGYDDSYHIIKGWIENTFGFPNSQVHPLPNFTILSVTEEPRSRRLSLDNMRRGRYIDVVPVCRDIFDKGGEGELVQRDGRYFGIKADIFTPPPAREGRIPRKIRRTLSCCALSRSKGETEELLASCNKDDTSE